MTPLTGRRRYRSTEHGLILQVEFCFWDSEFCRYGAWRCDWRDADIYDVMGIEIA